MTILEKIRPADNSVSSIESALFWLDEARAETVQRQADLAAARPELLLTGSDAAIKGNETAVAQTRVELERMDAFKPVLLDHLDAAKQADADATAKVLHDEAAAAIETWNNFAKGRYEILAREIVAGFDLEKAAIEAIKRTGGDHTLPAVAHTQCYGRPYRLHDLARLPRADGAAFVWGENPEIFNPYAPAQGRR